MRFTIEQGGTLYSIDATYYAAAVVGVLLSFVLLGTHAALRRRWDKVPWSGGRIAAAVLGGLVAMLAIVAPLLALAAVGLRSFADGFSGRSTSAAALFSSHISQMLGLSSLASVVTTIGFFLGLPRRAPQGRRLRRALFVVALAAAWFLAQAGAFQSVALINHHELPRLGSTLPAWIHQGQQLELSDDLVELPERPTWRPGDMPRVIEGAGEQVTVTLRASTWWLDVRRDVALPVKRELGHPAFPLRLGNRWELSKNQRASTRIALVLDDDRTTRTEAAWILEVQGVRVDRGVRRFRVVSTKEGRRPETLWMYAADGETYVHRERGEDVNVIKSWAPSSPGYSFPVEGGACRGAAAKSPLTPIPGPCLCAENKRSLGHVAVAVATLGLVIPRSSTTWILDRTVAGPEHAPFAPVDAARWSRPSVEEPAPCPPEDPDAEELCLRGRLRRDELAGRSDPAGRIEEMGLEVERRGELDLLVRGTAAQIREQLDAEVSWESREGLCPLERVCAPTRLRTSYRVLRDLGLTSLRLDPWTCGSEASRRSSSREHTR